MADITLSKAVRSNLLNLQSTADLLGTTQERLATGKKVNSALDNPTNFFTASSLNSRASDMGSLLDSMANGIQTLEAADNGLTAITKNLEAMQSTLTQARQDKSFKTQSFTLDADTIGTTALKTMSFSGGAVGDTPQTVALNSIDDAGTIGTVGDTTYAVPGAGTKSVLSTSAAWTDPAAVTATASNAFVAPTAAETADFEVNGHAISLDATTGADIDTAITNIQAQLDAATTAGAYTVDKDAGGTKLTITGPVGEAVAITGVANSGTGVSGFVNGTDDAAASLGTAAVDKTFTVNTDYAVTIDAGSTLAEALADINTGLDGSGFTAIEDPDNAGKILIQEDTAGGAALSITGGDTLALFGTATVTDTGTAGTTYSFTVNGGDEITVDPGTSLADAVTSINTQLGTDSAFEAAADGGNLVIREKEALGATITLAGDDAATLFGATATDTGVAATSGEVKTVDQLVESINADFDGQVRASNDNGKLRIENLSTGELTVTGFNPTSAKVDGTATTKEIGGNTRRADLAAQFNELRDQLDKLSDDASFNGVNLLRGDNLQLTFNETGTSEINIRTKEGKAINSSNLGVSTTLTASQLDSDEAIDGFLKDIKGALDSVRSQSSSFGSNLSVVQNRQDFTKNMINTLETGASNLTLADTNEEAANLLALQTRQQLSSTALSLASQADQNVLRLF